jgi:hypothetical protein
MAFFDWPWQTAIDAVYAKLYKLEKRIMTQQTSLDNLTAKINAITTAVSTVGVDVTSALTQITDLKAQIVALQGNLTAVDDSSALDALAAKADEIISTLGTTAASIEAVVAAAKA